MQTQDFNPDPRPLPVGWTQHYEPTKQLWYYVQTNIIPPKVSFTHPIDIVPNRKASPYPSTDKNTRMPHAVSPVQTPRNPSQSVGSLTFAQQLYASSMSSSLSPMINSHSTPHSQLSSMHLRNLPTPSSSSSPPPGTETHALNAPLNGSSILPPSHQSHIINHPSPNFNSIPSTAPPLSKFHRANTFQTQIPSNSSHALLHRAVTYDPGTPQLSVNINPSMTGPRPTRHLVTMARPPDQQSSSALSPLVLEPLGSVHSAPAVPSPPASSILFSGTVSTSPLTPPLIVQSTPVTPPNVSFSVPSGTAYKPQNPPLGKVAGVAQNLARSFADGVVRSLADGVVSTLKSVFLTPGTGVDQFSLQAVIQGRPDADYKRIINALIKLHQQQQQNFSFMKLQNQQLPPTTIDYQALIADVQRVQALARQAQQIATAQQQQQQFAQLHASAQLQAAQLQHQQQQAGQPVQGQQQPQQPEPTAAQKYQALVQQQYQQQAAAQQQQQLQQVLTQQQHQQQAAAQQQQLQLQQVLAQQQQLQQAAQYQALLQQQQAAAQAQQNQPPHHHQQQQQHGATTQSALQPYLEVYNLFQQLNGSGGGDTDTSGGQTQPSFDPTSLYSMDDSDNGGTGLFDALSQSLGNLGGSDGGQGFSDFLSVSFNQDNTGGFDMTLDLSGQTNSN